MDDWQSWVVLAVTTIVGMLVRSSFSEKQRRDTKDVEHDKRLAEIEKDLAILQKTALTEKEVGDIIREENQTLHDKIEKVDKHLEKLDSGIVKLTTMLTDVQIAYNRDVYHNRMTKGGEHGK